MTLLYLSSIKLSLHIIGYLSPSKVKSLSFSVIGTEYWGKEGSRGVLITQGQGMEYGGTGDNMKGKLDLTCAHLSFQCDPVSKYVTKEMVLGHAGSPSISLWGVTSSLLCPPVFTSFVPTTPFCHVFICGLGCYEMKFVPRV